MIPSWATVVTDNACDSGDRVLVPFSDRGLSDEQDAFNFYQRSCRITVDQTFGMIVNKFGILWTPIQQTVHTSTSIVVACFRPHNFILAEDPEYASCINPQNREQGSPHVFLQDEPQMESTEATCDVGSESVPVQRSSTTENGTINTIMLALRRECLVRPR